MENGNVPPVAHHRPSEDALRAAPSVTEHRTQHRPSKNALRAAPLVPRSSHHHPLTAVRALRGWSYRDLAEAVAVQSRTLGVPMAARREKAWRWEHWGVVPDTDSQRALAMALGVPLPQVESRPWPGWLPTGADLPADLPWNPEGAFAALRKLLADISEDQRAFPIADPVVLLDAAAAWSEGSRPGAAGRWAVDGPDGPDTLNAPDTPEDQLACWLRSNTAAVRHLLLAAPDTSSDALRRRIDADLRLIVDRLGAAPAPRLYQAAAQLAELGARICQDDLLHAPTQRYFLTALRCAHSAGDRALGASLLGALSRHSAQVGQDCAARRFRALALELNPVPGHDVHIGLPWAGAR